MNYKKLKQFQLDWLKEIYRDWAEFNNISIETADRYYFRVIDGAECDATPEQVKWLQNYAKKFQSVNNGF